MANDYNVLDTPVPSSSVPFTPTGGLSADDVAEALAELDAEKLPLSAAVAIPFIIDGGGVAITTGQKGHLTVPFNATINQVTVLADQSGSIVVDIWKDTYANYPPAVGDTITASAKPTISAATKSQDSTLTGWTTTVAAGDVLAFNVDSATTVTRVLLSLRAVRT